MCNFGIYNINDLPEVWHKVESKTTNKYIHFEHKKKGFFQRQIIKFTRIEDTGTVNVEQTTWAT